MLRITKAHAETMIDHALREAPNECCGIVAGNNQTGAHIYPITNSAKSPYRYLMDPQEQLNAMLDADRNGWDLLAFYHSHTHGPAYPSQVDVRMAIETGWLDIFYLLVSLEHKEPNIRTFRIQDDGAIVEKSLEVI